MYVGIASGGVFTGDHAKQPDFLTPYLKAAFACVGLTSLQFLPLQATAYLDEKQVARSRHELMAQMKIMTSPHPDQCRRASVNS